jgi:large conductance mechanosensitive channel
VADKQEPAPEEKHHRFRRPHLISHREVVMTVPALHVPGPFQGFVNFVREQGVVGLAVGLVLGTQVKSLVDQIVTSFINPLLGLLLPGKGSLADKVFHLSWNDKTAVFTYGAFLNVVISFIAVAAIIYLAVKSLKLERLDKKKA